MTKQAEWTFDLLKVYDGADRGAGERSFPQLARAVGLDCVYRRRDLEEIRRSQQRDSKPIVWGECRSWERRGLPRITPNNLSSQSGRTIVQNFYFGFLGYLPFLACLV